RVRPIELQRPPKLPGGRPRRPADRPRVPVPRNVGENRSRPLVEPVCRDETSGRGRDRHPETRRGAQLPVAPPHRDPPRLPPPPPTPPSPLSPSAPSTCYAPPPLPAVLPVAPPTSPPFPSPATSARPVPAPSFTPYATTRPVSAAVTVTPKLVGVLSCPS